MADGSLIFDTRIDENGFNNGVQNIGSSVSNLKGTFKKLGVAIVTAFSVKAITNFSKECTKLAEIQTNAEVKLETIMRQRMQATNESIQSVKDFTSAQQELGVVGDEVQLSGAQQLATFLKTDEALKSLIPAMNNLAVQQNGVNVSTEAMTNIGNLMGKVMQGQTSALTRVGISFSEAEEQVLKYGNEQERAVMLAKVITNNVGEMNKALASTPAGRMQQVSNSLGDIQETLGRAVNNIFAPLIKYIEIAVSRLAEFANAFENVTKKLFGDSNKSVNTGGISAVADSADIATENLEETEKQAKKLEKRLAGFDNLNVLTDEDISSSENDTQKNSATALPVISTTDITPTENSINELSDIFQRFLKKLEPVKNALEKLWEALKPFQKFVSKALEDFYNNFLKPLGEWVLGTGLPRLLDIITDLLNSINWNKLNKALADFWKSLEPFAENIGNGLLWFLENVLSPLAKWTINDVIPAFLNVLSGAIDVLNTAIETVKPVIKWFFDNFLTPIAEWTGGIIVSILKGIASGLKAIAEVPEAVIILESVAAAILAFQLYQFITGLNLAAIATGALSGAQAILNAVMAANPIGILIAILAGLIAALILLWNNCEWFRDFWINAWENIKTTLSNVWKSITEIFGNIGRWFADRFAEAVNGIKNAFKGISDFFSNIWKGITNAFSNVTNWFKNTFSKAWQSVKDVFSKGGEIFNGIKDGILNSLKSVINGLIDGINTVISIPFNGINTALEKIKGIEIAGWKPFEWINTIQTPQIPKLATGTVVPAHYGEFLAVLGDNKRETEVVSPLSTMKQAMREVLGEMNTTGNSGNVEYRFIAQIGRRVIFDEIVEEDKLYRKRHGGKSAFVR